MPWFADISCSEVLNPLSEIIVLLNIIFISVPIFIERWNYINARKSNEHEMSLITAKR